MNHICLEVQNGGACFWRGMQSCNFPCRLHLFKIKFEIVIRFPSIGCVSGLGVHANKYKDTHLGMYKYFVFPVPFYAVIDLPYTHYLGPALFKFYTIQVPSILHGHDHWKGEKARPLCLFRLREGKWIKETFKHICYVPKFGT